MSFSSKPRRNSRETLPERLRRLGERLRDYRRQRGWTQRALSARARIRTQRISRIENGRSEPSILEVVRLASVYETSLEELLLGAPLPRRAPEGLLARDLQAIVEFGQPQDLAAVARVVELVSDGLRALHLRSTTP